MNLYKITNTKENKTVSNYNDFNENTKKHIGAIIASPIYAPQVRDYFYQVARVGTMNYERARSANPIPTFPTISMIANQQNYAVRLGESILIDKDFTETLIDKAINDAGESNTIAASEIAERVANHVLG